MKDTGFDSLCQLIADRLGIEVRQRDRKKVAAAIATRCQDRKLEGPEQYAQFLSNATRESTAEWQRLASLLTTGETFFFRDKGHIRLLRERILPELIALRRAEKSLRIWSAGCASGEEPYSVAMLLQEVLPDIDRWKIFILGTDIDAVALDKARRGVYTAWSFRNVGPRTRDTYFRPHGDSWEINDQVKQRVTFQSLNLLRDSIPGTVAAGMDLIVCRNVFIYFKQEHIAQVAGKLADSLRVGGYLLTGHGELQGHDVAPLERSIFDDLVAHRKTEPPPAIQHGTQMSDTSPLPTSSPKSCTHISPPVTVNEGTADERAEPTLPDRSAEASTVVDAIERLLAEGHYRAALERAEQAAVVCPQGAQLDYLMARAHADLGQHGSAIDACQRAIAADAFAVEPQYLLAHIAEEQGRFEDATHLLKKVIYLDPSHLNAHLSLIALCQRQGDVRQATRLRRAAIALLQALPENAPVGEAGDATAGQLIQHLNETRRNA